MSFFTQTHQELDDDLSQMNQSLQEFHSVFPVYATDAYDAVSAKDYARAERHIISLYLAYEPYIAGLMRCYYRIQQLKGNPHYGRP